MIRRPLLFVNKPIDTIKFSADSGDTSYKLGRSTEVLPGTPDVLWTQLAVISELNMIWSHGNFMSDLSNLITSEEFDPVATAAYGSIQQGTLGKINGKSLEEYDITIDMTLVRIVTELPTENIDDNKIYLVANKSESGENVFNEYIHHTPEEGDPFWELLGKFDEEIDLSEYLKKTEADKLYMPIGSSSSSGSSLSVSQTGSFNNYGDNGQAFNAVRDLTGKSDKYNLPTGSGFPLNAASFGVKDNGTTAFTHKKYTTFNKETGAYTGAKNTAVLTFSGKSGLLYAKNTGSGNDVTEDMYKRVGVIDSPDEAQRVYSAAQVDALLAERDAEIAALRALIEDK